MEEINNLKEQNEDFQNNDLNYEIEVEEIDKIIFNSSDEIFFINLPSLILV